MFFALTKTFHYHLANFYKTKNSQPATPNNIIEIGTAYKVKDVTITLLQKDGLAKLCIMNHSIDPIYRDIDLKNDTQEEVKKLVKMAIEILE